MTKLHHNLGMALRTVFLVVISEVCPLAFLTTVGTGLWFPVHNIFVGQYILLAWKISVAPCAPHCFGAIVGCSLYEEAVKNTLNN
jgi:hypothetical protein